MTNDADVLTRIRVAAVDDAPALTLQVEDLVRTGRRRRLATRVVSASALAAVAAGVFVVAVSQNDPGEAPTPGPVDQFTEPPSSYTTHMMPALLKEVVLSEFVGAEPDWKTFDIAAFGNVEGRDAAVPLPEPLWDQASRWELRGATDDHSVELWLTAEDFSSTEGDPEEYCESRLAEGSLACKSDTLPDGRTVISQWWRDDQDNDVGVAGDTNSWFRQSVAVYREGSGYIVVTRQGVQASSFVQAQRDAWLEDEAMHRIASSPDIDLETVLGPTATGVR